jgi:septum formation protein
LASASPRRRELLGGIGIPLSVRSVDLDERSLQGESADDYLVRIVAAKLVAAQALTEAGSARAILVADTAVILGDRILGKPRDDDDARHMLRLLSGARHRVATRYALAAGDALVAETITTEVEFRVIDGALLERYVASGEGRDKAGAYAIQGIGSMLVRRIDGSYSNVVGLPVCEVVLALERLGLFPWRDRR